MRDRGNAGFGEADEVGRGELELQAAAARAHVDRLERKRRLVDDRRQAPPLSERADAARDVAGGALGMLVMGACSGRDGGTDEGEVDTDTVSATEYATGMCGAIAGWIEGIQRLNADLQANLDPTASLELVDTPPEIDDADVRAAVESFANPAVSAAVTLVFGNSRVRLKARFLGDGEVRDLAKKGTK